MRQCWGVLHLCKLGSILSNAHPTVVCTHTYNQFEISAHASGAAVCVCASPHHTASIHIYVAYWPPVVKARTTASYFVHKRSGSGYMGDAFKTYIDCLCMQRCMSTYINPCNVLEYSMDPRRMPCSNWVKPYVLYRMPNVRRETNRNCISRKLTAFFNP